MQRTVVITGANTGIGKATAMSLAAAGDRVFLACRNAAKASAARADILEKFPYAAVETIALDLADLRSVRQCASELVEQLDHIDVLINNAGVLLSKRTETQQGIESTFGVNHVGPFVFTDALQGLLESADSARVINLASLAHVGAVGGLKWDDLQTTKHYNGWLVYCRSKLANILFTQELARRMKPAGVCVSCVHPGAVNSEFGKEGDTTGLSAKLMGYAHFVTIPVDQGADTSIWLATAAAGGDLSRSGTYWFKRRPARLAPWAKREAEPARLWAATEDLVATVENR
jgi:NAD(P)-dependent dehydrogenase (short-subunit alcohol dehydrogenase family)